MRLGHPCNTSSHLQEELLDIMNRGSASSSSLSLPPRKSKPQAASAAISQSSLYDLKSITAEHIDAFTKDGRKAIRGGGGRTRIVEKTKDQFDRPSPGLVKRLARESKQELELQSKNRARDFDEESEEAEARRKANMLKKAEKYELMQRGRLEGLSEKELAECVIDFERKWQEKQKPPPRARRKIEDDSGSNSDSSFASDSDEVDESATVPRRPGSDDEDDQVEYIDELGRTRMGSKAEAEKAARSGGVYETKTRASEYAQAGESYAEVQKSSVIYGDQTYFPEYVPDAEDLKARMKKAEGPSLVDHYDATKEVRVKAAGQYQFSLDEKERAEQMAALNKAREETENARKRTGERAGLSAAQAANKRKADERRALIEAKRAKLLGGEKVVERLREEKRMREAEDFLAGVEEQLAAGKPSSS